jgi:hypothetical protein
MITQILNKHADSLQKIWAHDRSQTIGASEIGQCSRKTFWIKNEVDPVHRAERDPEYVDGWGAKIRGTIMENDFWYPAMRAAYGELLLYAGPEQQSFISGFLSATPDGLVTGQAKDYDDYLQVPICLHCWLIVIRISPASYAGNCSRLFRQQRRG